ncbi:Glu/Leu/Phe/Val dehydrogenase dimerization domain-containing protein [Paractinoplanes hotanensis]|uniref:Glutamate/phenylalanine/leucine/valine/L-tryptophan dehydrogenase C-terminal domain-containing protein n=1 Tax=Paractinoplanes hotanensis TaxID=2906497 RepID=A0ABT0YCZ8_9ACTN|nr:Glu/Leu/Phe/Val dehydrogenase dimerization domain-containing protein [Actinoplanes hotanensis]MCM4083119.1 hypothetical protein [Actinoplanes hotanensis]
MTSQFRLFLQDPDAGLEAFVVADSLVGGRAMGGTRMTAGVTVDEVADLAAAMTRKLALAGIPIGGAKAGIRCGLPPGPARDRVLRAFGRAVAPLLRGGVYLGSDQGVTHADRDRFFAAAHYRPEDSLPWLPCGWPELWHACEDVTGFGVCESVDAAATDYLPADSGRRVAVQGFGLVGRAVATGLSRRGYSIVAVADRAGTVAAPTGLPVPGIIAATDAFGTIDRHALPTGVQILDRAEAWLDLPSDVLVLAAGGHAVHERNVDRVQAKLVVEGSNLGCSPGAERVLAARGVPVLPGPVANIGGAAVTGLLLTDGMPATTDVPGLVNGLFARVAATVRANTIEVVRRGRAEARCLSAVADDLAAQRTAERGIRVEVVSA